MTLARGIYTLLTVALVASACSAPPDEAASTAGESNEPARIRSERTVVVGKAPSGAFVRLEPLFEQEFPESRAEGVVDQTGQMFLPSSQVARTGQRMEFRSSEDVLHNIRVIRAEDKATIFNVVTPPWGSYTHTFSEAGTYEVTCDIHTAMRATILVTPTPYATIADDSGNFSFSDVVPGRYKLIGFSGENALEREVEISGPRRELQLP